MSVEQSVVMIGGTGAVGGEVIGQLAEMNKVTRLTVLGRRPVENVVSDKIVQHVVDIENPETYRSFLAGHTIAISTLGVGQPSKISKAQFLKIDRDANLHFGQHCKVAGILHFQLLSSVGVDASSSSFFLRSKGELEAGLKALDFDRLSLFHPSMILTPTNRYGLSQGLTLLFWPLLKPLLQGPMRKLRGIKLATLGAAIANNVGVPKSTDIEILEWDDLVKLSSVRV